MADVPKRLILVEGQTDKAVFRALLEAHSITGYWCCAVGGKSKFQSTLKLLQNNPPTLNDQPWPLRFDELTHLVLARDADQSPAAALQSLQSAVQTVQNVGLAAPRQTMSWSAARSQPQVGLMVLPSDKQAGTLENLLLDAFPPQALECLRALLVCLPNAAPGLFTHLPPAEHFGQEAWSRGLEKKLVRLLGSLHFDPQTGTHFESSFRQPAGWPLDVPVWAPLVDFLRA